MKPLIVATLFAGFGLCAVAAHADGADTSDRRAGMQKLHARFDAADSNHDGYLSREEAHKGMPRIGAHFDAADTDHDGRLSPAEVGSFVAAARAGRGK